MHKYDVIVIGAGNAALSAALSAKDNGAKKILVLEKASAKERGGNSRYTNGAYRFAYNGFSDLKKIMARYTSISGVSDKTLQKIYSEESQHIDQINEWHDKNFIKKM